MLLGQFKHSLDDKGRIIVPTRFRSKLGEQVVISKGFDGCLVLRAYDVFIKWQEQILLSSEGLKDSRILQRQIFANSLELNIDKVGRINLPSNLLILANIKKEVMIIGLANKIEIWDIKAWENYLVNAENNLEQSAQNLIMNIEEKN